jgi:hypothetical protein
MRYWTGATAFIVPVNPASLIHERPRSRALLEGSSGAGRSADRIVDFRDDLGGVLDLHYQAVVALAPFRTVSEGVFSEDSLQNPA